jgi:hypothetical protein
MPVNLSGSHLSGPHLPRGVARTLLGARSAHDAG